MAAWGLMILVLGLMLALLALAAYEWTRLVLSVYQSLSDRLDWSSRETSRRARPPGEGDLDGSERYQPGRQASSSDAAHSSPPRAGGLLLAPLSLAAAESPNFEAFWGGIETAIAAGGILVIALVVVLTVRRMTNF